MQPGERIGLWMARQVCSINAINVSVVPCGQKSWRTHMQKKTHNLRRREDLLLRPLQDLGAFEVDFFWSVHCPVRTAALSRFTLKQPTRFLPESIGMIENDGKIAARSKLCFKGNCKGKPKPIAHATGHATTPFSHFSYAL